MTTQYSPRANLLKTDHKINCVPLQQHYTSADEISPVIYHTKCTERAVGLGKKTDVLIKPNHNTRYYTPLSESHPIGHDVITILCALNGGSKVTLRDHSKGS